MPHPTEFSGCLYNYVWDADLVRDDLQGLRGGASGGGQRVYWWWTRRDS